jgi:hypothetical protein
MGGLASSAHCMFVLFWAGKNNIIYYINIEEVNKNLYAVSAKIG